MTTLHLPRKLEVVALNNMLGSGFLPAEARDKMFQRLQKSPPKTDHAAASETEEVGVSVADVADEIRATVAEAALIYGIGTTTVKSRLKKGELTGTKDAKGHWTVVVPM